jgi:pre-rRNA-processing protein TSR1
MSKLDRRNQARQKQLTKHKEHLKETSIFAGRDGAPRIVAIVPLCADVNAAAVVRQLDRSVGMASDVPEEGLLRSEIDRFKQKIQYIILNRDLIACMDACKIADFVVFVLSPEQEVDELGESIIRIVENQGISTLLTVVQGLDNVQPPKRRVQIAGSLKSYITHFHPEQEKIHNMDSTQECANLMRSLCTMTPKGVRWREERSWMLVEEVRWADDESPHVSLVGTVRGKGLKADRLVQVGDWGDFQIEKITAAPLACRKNRSNGVAMDQDLGGSILETPSIDQDDLAELAPEEVLMEDITDTTPVAPLAKRGVLLDDHHYFSDDETHIPSAPKRVPNGTSSYQAAWFLGDDMSDSGSDYDDVGEQGDVNMDDPVLPQDGVEGFAPPESTAAAPTEYPQSEMFLDPTPDEEAEQLAAFRAQKGDEAAEDREFPDEIELHPKVLARERLARYRGLKSLRTSRWDETEDRAYEPEEWRRLLQVPDYKSSRSKVTREALVGGVKSGTRVQVHLRDVPVQARDTYQPSQPLTLFSLLRHEHKRAALNFGITLSSEHPSSIRSKEELILQCGPRRFIINPIFSQAGNPQNHIHKFDRFLHPGASSIASFVGPLTWGSVPALFFKRSSPTASTLAPLTLIAAGTALPPSNSRVIAKRIILTGHPYKIHKKLVTIRYMFFNREDVEWFKALQLWTKRGRSGFIKESLGTHGYFKATFDGKINAQDAVGVSLYKRMWPRSSRPWRQWDETSAPEQANGGEVEMAEADKGALI